MLCRSMTVICGLLLVACGNLAAEDKCSKKKAPETMDRMPLIFSEDFEEGTENWVPTDEKAWKITENKDGSKVYGTVIRVSNYKPPHRSPHNISLIKDLAVSDFIFTAKVQSTADTGGHRDMCIFFNYQDPANFYYVHMGKKPDPNSSQIMIVDDAPRKPITENESPGVPWTGDWHKVKVVRKVDTGAIEIYFDDMDKPIMVATNKTFKAGQIGVGSFDDLGNWDDIKIYGKKVCVKKDEAKK